MTLNEWGLYKLDEYDKARKENRGFPPKAKPVASKTEDDIYKALGMPCIEPELREDRGEIEAALAGKLPKLDRSSKTSAAISIPTPPPPTAKTPSKKWPTPPRPSATNSSPSPTTPRAR